MNIFIQFHYESMHILFRIHWGLKLVFFNSLVYRASPFIKDPLKYLRNTALNKKIFQKSFFYFEEDIRWYHHWFNLGWRCRDQGKIILNFFNWTPHLSLHILVAYFESFLEHYKKLFFIKYFLIYKAWKLQYQY